MAKFRDYYQELGVDRNASEADIKHAYRRLARKYHPDVSREADAEARFKTINEAYTVLKDADKRAAYDALGKNWQAGEDFRPPPDWDAGFEFHGNAGGARFSDFSEFFESLFGNRAWQNDDHHRTRDHHGKILITLEEAQRGASKTVSLKEPIFDQQGQLSLQERQLQIRIPAGVREGQLLRLNQQAAGVTGDLYLEIGFHPHPLFTVDGADIYLELPITPWEAALGASVTVPTLQGKVKASIPAGSRSGQKLRLKARGLGNQQPGDQYLVLRIEIPPAHSEAHKTFYRRMAEEFAFNPRKQLDNYHGN